MSRILVLGGGVAGLAAGLLLAQEGHEVDVWERDAEPVPSSLEGAWETWERPGVKQFRQPHSLQARVRATLERELPDVYEAFLGAGAARLDPIDRLPASISDRDRRPGDERLVAVTGRRPTIEAIVARIAEEQPGLCIRRDHAAVGLTVRSHNGTPHVTGVRTETRDWPFDLVVDAMGRSSPLPSWLRDLGTAPMLEESEDSGFAYYTRFFRSRNGAVPELRTNLLTPVGSFSILTLPGDRNTWSITLYAAAGDTPLKAFRHLDRWEKVVRACPLHAHWLEGEPISDMTIMAGVLDRRRRLATDGRPVATGIVLVADSWACTNPSLARGLALGLDHVARLRDTVRDNLESPRDLTLAWDDVTEAEFTPWYAATIASDRARLAEIGTLQRGDVPPSPKDEQESIRARLPLAAMRDATAYRALAEMIACLALPNEVFSRDEVLEAVSGTTEPGERLLPAGPSRAKLLSMLA